MQDTLYVKIDKENILQEIIVDLPKYEVHIDKSQIGNSNEERLKYNILAVARKNSFVKKKIDRECPDRSFFVVLKVSEDQDYRTFLKTMAVREVL